MDPLAPASDLPVPFERPPLGVLGDQVPSFVEPDDTNLHQSSVAAFGDEWERFSEFTDDEVEAGGREYFAGLITDDSLAGARVLDVGCGSGRWTRYFARRAGFVEAADPSRAALVAARATSTCPNVRVIHAGVSRLPYPAGTFDLAAAVGVLHHVPDTAAAIGSLATLIKPGGRLFLYLYYQLDGRPLPYRSAFVLAQGLRYSISRLPRAARIAVCELAAVGIYGPLVLLARMARHLAPRRGWHEQIPLHYYIDKPWKVIRNDALDRLGTPLERRFSQADIRHMLERAGFEDIRFADAMPRWRVLATKAVRG